MSAKKRLLIPAYLRIYEELRSRIRSGEWKVGDAVEPVPLADDSASVH